jgi:plasmid stabilization system protein ParE
LTPAFLVRVTRRAAAQIQRVVAWWEVNRPLAPGAVVEELDRAFALLRFQPGIGARARNVRLSDVRRLHLGRIHYFLYYRVRGNTVVVLAFWHTSRGSGPEI